MWCQRLQRGARMRGESLGRDAISISRQKEAAYQGSGLLEAGAAPAGS